MRPFRANELLNLWENTLESSNLEKSLKLLALLYELPSTTQAANWSIGQRDARLFLFRTQLFGTDFKNTATCPKCSEQVEWNMQLADFPLPDLKATTEKEFFTLAIAPYQLQFRLPTTQDLNANDAQQLLANCIVELKKEEADCTVEELPTSVLEALNQELERIEPLANLNLLLNCPNCTQQWEVFFDIMSYLWAELDSWSKHLLQEVYLLARAFAWSERDILNMSAKRRQFYLDMIGG